MDTKRHNDLLSASRERTPSRLAPGECMSRRELAEAVNAWLWETTRQRYDRARVRAQQQDVDEAADLARESLAIAVYTGSEASIRRIRRLRPELARWDGARSVRALDEQLEGLR